MLTPATCATFVIKLMTMVERIRTLLETRQLTPTQFADAIGIARPIVSHILSGRNKPSLDVVQRILAAMPDLSMPWLLNGTGPMLASATQPVPVTSTAPVATPLQTPTAARQSTSSTVAAETTSFSSPHRPAPVAPPAALATEATRPALRRFTLPANKAVPVDKAVASEPTTQLAPAAPAKVPPAPVSTAQETEALPEPSSPAPTQPKETVVTSETQPPVNATAAALFAGAEKPIRRIVIFYRDGSFADYQPE
jgi:transcriptional regulator with XRE-family HTH domain